jgi:hypothetical protein
MAGELRERLPFFLLQMEVITNSLPFFCPGSEGYEQSATGKAPEGTNTAEEFTYDSSECHQTLGI